MKLKCLFFLFIITFPCNAQNGKPLKIDPRDFVENKITLADIADDIIYIPLDNQYTIGNFYSYKIVKNAIYIPDRKIGLLAFDRYGKTSRKIGSIGRGPGEYVMCIDFAIDDNFETIYIMDVGNIIKVYSKNGNYIRSIHLEEYGGRFSKVEVYNSKLFVSEFINMGQAKYNWIILDTLGALIKQKKNSILLFSSSVVGGGGVYKSDNKISYWNLYSDTVFSILPDLSYNTSLTFSPGNYRWPASNVRPGPSSPYMQPHSLFESNRFLIFTYSYNGKETIALIDKKSNKSFLTFLEGHGPFIGGIINNIDGGIKFQPRSCFSENDQEYILGLMEPYQLKTYVATNEFKSFTPKFPEKKKELEKLADRVNENDNSILMLLKLKK